MPDRLGFALDDLAGAHASGEIPLTAGLINRLIDARLAASHTAIASIVLEPRHGNVILAHVRVRTAFVPLLTVQVFIEEQPRLPESPVLVLRWSLTGLGILARLASPVLALFEILPPGVSMSGDRVAIDLAKMLHAQGHGDLLPLMTHLEVTAEDGRILVRFDARVPEPQAPAVSLSTSG